MSYRFKCADCGEWHDGLPDVGYDYPDYVTAVPDSERPKRVFLTSDLCSVDNEHFFIRCRMVLVIREIGELWGWGVWSSLSEANFHRYREHYDEDMSDWSPMFGWLSNRLPDYPDTLSLKLSVQPQTKGMRPLVTLEPTDHPLAVEQREGIGLERVLKLTRPFRHE